MNANEIKVITDSGLVSHVTNVTPIYSDGPDGKPIVTGTTVETTTVDVVTGKKYRQVLLNPCQCQ